MERRLAGMLAAEGDVAFRGSSLDDLRNTVEGRADITLTDGAIIFPAGGELKEPHEFPFTKVQAHLSYAGRVLDMRSARIEAFNGVINGEGGVDFKAADGPGYRLKCTLANIDAAKFFRAFDVTRDLSGTLNLKAELTARGPGVTAVRKTLVGTVEVHLKKGVIKKYGFISKVFSVLNVSQLLDLRLPDVMTSGMPYDRVDGTYNLDNGKVSTRDLSMYSPSLNMTVVGEGDLVKMEIDVKIGVQALQTVGRIVSRIPIVGWLLTGGKKRFLVVYYEAKGKWDNPTVSTLPRTAISSGILNIFKRAFELPNAMITQPGKVFLGQ
jgi:uncharacterized protein YhdP